MLSTGLWWSLNNLNNHWSRGFVPLAQKSKWLFSLLTQLVFQRVTTDCRHCWLLHWPLQNSFWQKGSNVCAITLVLMVALASPLRATRSAELVPSGSAPLPGFLQWGGAGQGLISCCSIPLIDSLVGCRVSANEGWLDICHYLWLGAQPPQLLTASHIFSSLDDPA